MTLIRANITLAGLAVLFGLVACGKDEIIETCDEPQSYESIVEGKRIVVPEGLDPLDEFKEMPVPVVQAAPRPDGARCLTSAPSILTGGTNQN